MATIHTIDEKRARRNTNLREKLLHRADSKEVGQLLVGEHEFYPTYPLRTTLIRIFRKSARPSFLASIMPENAPFRCFMVTRPQFELVKPLLRGVARTPYDTTPSRNCVLCRHPSGLCLLEACNFAIQETKENDDDEQQQQQTAPFTERLEAITRLLGTEHERRSEEIGRLVTGLERAPLLVVNDGKAKRFLVTDDQYVSIWHLLESHREFPVGLGVSCSVCCDVVGGYTSPCRLDANNYVLVGMNSVLRQ